MPACDFSYLTGLKNTADGRTPFFADQHGRSLLLHGVNVSGAAKLPASPAPDCLYPENDAFWDSARFTGRPFPLDEAAVHWTRLKDYGLCLIRFVMVWEAVEIAPGIYDDEYIDYVHELLQVASSVGLLVIIDCHQDCWSRFTGGSGAPLWTLDLAGLDTRLFAACGAALLQTPSLDMYAEPGTLWATNYCKFAINTMFTLFFAGEIFAPNTRVGNENIGTFLRRSYVECFAEVAKRLSNISAVIGFDVMNEPHPGFIGLKTLNKFDENILLHLGDMPSALQSMRLAAGIPQKVPVYTKSWPVPTKCTSYRLVNENRYRAWKAGSEDVWKLHGVWSEKEHKDEYFSRFPSHHERSGDLVHFNDDCYMPFLHEFRDQIRSKNPRAWTFVEPIPNTLELSLSTFSTIEDICFAPHWYDLKALFEKKFSTWMTMDVQSLSQGSRNLLAHTYFGRKQAVDNYSRQIAALFRKAEPCYPRLIGETGIPFDMNLHYSISKVRGRHDYQTQSLMLDIMCSAMERNLVSYTLWNYTPENRAYEGGGDLWNGEDFSIYCHSQAAYADSHVSLYAGARAPEAWIRPNATKIAGEPILSQFDLHCRQYKLTFRPSRGQTEISRQTEIFIPRIHLVDNEELKLTHDGVNASWRLDLNAQTLYFIHKQHEFDEEPGVCNILICFGGAKHTDNSLMRNRHTIISIVLLLAILCRCMLAYF